MGQYSFKLPDVGEGTAEAEIAEWRVKVGDRVEEDQPLVDMMTDKATVELTSPVAGVVQSIAGKVARRPRLDRCWWCWKQPRARASPPPHLLKRNKPWLRWRPPRSPMSRSRM